LYVVCRIILNKYIFTLFYLTKCSLNIYLPVFYIYVKVEISFPKVINVTVDYVCSGDGPTAVSLAT